jgi:hypothetical protein
MMMESGDGWNDRVERDSLGAFEQKDKVRFDGWKSGEGTRG